MEPGTIASLSGLLALVYFVCVIGIIVFALMLLARFVSAHERLANALEVISRKTRDDDKAIH